MEQYLPLVTMGVLAILFAGVSALVSKLLAPRRPTPAKLAPYECGIVPRRDPPDRFPVKFYLVAMIFIIFDIEIVFLYPYATMFRDIGFTGLVELLLFSIAVFVSFCYLLSNGALSWGPLKSLRPVADAEMVSANRTAATTIKRVGLEGREPVGPEPATEAA